MKQYMFSLSLATATTLGTLAMADAVVLDASKDNTLYENGDGLISNGAGEHTFSGMTGNGLIRRTVIAFDVSSIPAGSTITDVSMILFMSKTIANARDISAHRLTADWGEADSDAFGSEGMGAPAEPGDATWLHTFSPGSLWTNAGGDFDNTASATTSVDNIGLYIWGGQGMINDVQSWVDGNTDNFGWILINQENPDVISAKRFDSRENDNANNRPRLIVTFDPPASTATVTDFDYLRGVPLSGGVPELQASDDQYLRGNSVFGFLSSEPNLLEVLFGLEAPAGSFSELDITLEQRANNPGGNVTVRLRNWDTNGLENIGSYGLNNSDTTNTIADEDATDHIRSSDQRIEVTVKHVIIATFSLSGFQSRFDLVEVVPHN